MAQQPVDTYDLTFKHFLKKIFLNIVLFLKV